MMKQNNVLMEQNKKQSEQISDLINQNQKQSEQISELVSQIEVLTLKTAGNICCVYATLQHFRCRLV